MNIEQAIQEKRLVEALISKLVDDFADKTGLTVDDINLVDRPVGNHNVEGTYVELSVKLGGD